MPEKKEGGKKTPLVALKGKKKKFFCTREGFFSRGGKFFLKWEDLSIFYSSRKEKGADQLVPRSGKGGGRGFLTRVVGRDTDRVLSLIGERGREGLLCFLFGWRRRPWAIISLGGLDRDVNFAGQKGNVGLHPRAFSVTREGEKGPLCNPQRDLTDVLSATGFSAD